MTSKLAVVEMCPIGSVSYRWKIRPTRKSRQSMKVVDELYKIREGAHIKKDAINWLLRKSETTTKTLVTGNM